MKRNLKVAILGAGVSGLMMARELLKAGNSITVFEARAENDYRGAAYVAAAMLAPLAEAAASESYIGALGLASMPLWVKLIAEFAKPTSATPNEPIFFQQKGTLVIWHPNDRAEHTNFMRQLAQYVDEKPVSEKNHSRIQKTTPAANYQCINAETINQLEPMLKSRFSEAVFLNGEGQVDNIGVMKRLKDDVLAMSGTIHYQQPRSINDTINSNCPDLIIDCRGVGAGKEWLGNNALRGIRGEIMRVTSTEIKLNRPLRLLHPRYPLYIAPKPNHEFVIGATVIESDDSSPISVHSLMELSSALFAVHPAFAEARVLSASAAIRPTLTNHRPQIILSKRNSTSLVQINGLYRHGWLLAPIVVKSAIAAINMWQQSANNKQVANEWIQAQDFHDLFSVID